jgi:hypothetical protein
MTYVFGLAASVILSIAGGRIYHRVRGTSYGARLILHNLPALFLGCWLGFVFPAPFAERFELIMGAVLMVCAVWIGFSYGSAFDFRNTHRMTVSHGIFKIIGTGSLAVAIITAGTIFRIINPSSPLTGDAVLFIAAFGSLAMFSRDSGALDRMEGSPLRVLRHGSGAVMSIIPLILLSVAHAHGQADQGITIYGITLTGVLGRCSGALVAGISVGIVLIMLMRDTFDILPLRLIVTGCIVLIAGIAFSLGISPIMTAAVTGVVVINGSLRRREVLDIVDGGTDAVEQAMLFTVGVFCSRMLTAGNIPWGTILATALLFVLLRNAVAWTAAVIRKTRHSGAPFATAPAATLIAAQGLLPIAAMVEYQLGAQAHGTVFLFMAVALVLQRTVTIISVLVLR